jgi:hypothetical protein
LEAGLDFGFSDSESEPDPDPDPESDESFLAAFFGAGLSESESDPEEDDESFLAAFLAGAFFAGLSLSDESEPDEESFLAAFLAGAAFLPLTTSTSEESESEEEESSTLDFLTGTVAFSEVFLDLFLEADLSDLAETLDPALALLARTLAGFFSEELDEEELLLELDAFLFLSTFLDLVLSIDCFLDGASDEEAEAFLT